MYSNTALLAALKESEQYKAFVVDFEAKAAKALTETVYTVESLGGVELTLPEVAVYYQVYK
jgi:hypothetical protein